MHSQTQTLTKSAFNGSRSHTRRQALLHKSFKTTPVKKTARRFKVVSDEMPEDVMLARFEAEQQESDYRLGYGGFSGGMA